jgi:uncharacterized protein YjbJ (UPF0337 family)
MPAFAARRCIPETAGFHPSETSTTYERSKIMNKDHVKGAAEQLKGKVNEAVGKATGNTKQEVKGDLQQAAGEARKSVGDAKDALKK